MLRRYRNLMIFFCQRLRWRKESKWVKNRRYRGKRVTELRIDGMELRQAKIQPKKKCKKYLRENIRSLT